MYKIVYEWYMSECCSL